VPHLRELFARESRLAFGLLLALVAVHTVWGLWQPVHSWITLALFGVLAVGFGCFIHRRLLRLERDMDAQLEGLASTAERVERREPSGQHSAYGIPQVDRTERVLLKIGALLQEHEQLKAQLQALQRQQVTGLLARELAQGLTNRLTVVLGHLDLAVEGMAEGDGRRLHLRHAENAAKGCVESAQALLSFGSVRPEPATIDVNALADKVCGLLRRVVDDKIRVVLEFGSDLPQVQGDAARLEQVVMNLGLNARQAMDEGGTLTFRTSRNPDGWVALNVEDTGVGISAELLDRIWQPFFSTRPAADGVGLGLATSREILQDLGGRIQVLSNPGQGSVFTVLLPPAPRQIPAAPRPARPSFEGLRILLAEDEPEIRTVMKELLTRMGAEVVTGVDGEDAWNLWELLGPFDLLITDQRMPRLNGLELLARIRAGARDLPVLVMTGFGLEEAADVLEDDPRARLLAKPFTVPVLLEALSALAGKARTSLHLPG